MIVDKLADYITKGISFGGYIGVFFLMAMESTVLPVPSEIVMPFAGYLVLQGKFNFWVVLLASSLGSVFGSLLSYYLGLHGGRKLISKFGKYAFVDENHLVWTEEWFRNKGEKTILFSRFIPVVRHIISIPAGIGKMSLPKFLFYTLAGASIWNFMLLYAGLKLGSQWDKIHTFSSELDIIFIIALLLLITFYIWKHKKRGLKNRT